MTKQEIITLFKEFMREWVKNPDNECNIDGENKVKKPSWYDFMEWLSNQ